ncbi:hypothetical protein CJ739_3083 [Mariniflexile rhizosphaerae]|uniref:hypothetical protein n=1 Tax=unclassified Mariniflexile TaxID=2643887 RepID=UPI000CC865C5|nr:hypothetical protein [Mariniflexile sp. TRM1-10]AXP82145.1 hypothetical protein CJ739_3083 [Mariniflexile sp. TRM1-10]PLB20210.1 MAG: hypothetical protein TRG1_859 [Flavobacteriaceae bacterium FS1-H7996/R]
MGTTQRMTPGVRGETNWGDLSRSITHISKTVEKEKELDNNENTTSQDEAKQFKRIFDRRLAHLKAAFNNLVKTGGGRSKISSGKSSSIGKAGRKSAGKITSFFTGVASKGLQQALDDIGFGSLQGKSFQEVLDYLLVFCSDSNEGMDETAANNASCEIMKELAILAGNDLDKFELLVKGYVEGTGFAELLCKFWGLYIFEHLSQRFEEKVKQQKGAEIGKETFKIIKADILGQVKVLNTQRPVSKIDWKGNDGQKEIENIFDSVIKIICDEND